jgi:hypothetical protein
MTAPSRTEREPRDLPAVDRARVGSTRSFNLYGDEWDETRDREGWRIKETFVGHHIGGATDRYSAQLGDTDGAQRRIAGGATGSFGLGAGPSQFKSGLPDFCQSAAAGLSCSRV